VVLIVDEAQNLSPESLEQVRLLTNLETDTQKLLQVVLIGQPELREALAKPELRQLAQRITARFHLTPLSEHETGEYLRHRFRVAGGRHFPLTAAAVRRVHRHANGVPRLANVIAERALLAGYARDAATIDPKLVDAAAREVLPARNAMDGRLPTAWLLATAGALLLGLIGWAFWRPATQTGAPVAPKAAIPRKHAEPTAAKPAIPRLDADALASTIDAASASPAPAWESLLAEWKLPASTITVDPASAACTATVADVHCVQGRARLDTLLALDRPLLLRLHGVSGQTWGVLLGLDARDARIALSGASYDIDRLALQSSWTGEYAGLWRGSDPALPVDIAAFQNARGLAADGVAGPETLMALAGDAPGPHLLRVLE
jgi:general secretion pathway protein A